MTDQHTSSTHDASAPIETFDWISFIAGMPKAEHHVHIEGTLEPEMKFDLAARNGIDLPFKTVAEMRASYVYDDLPSFLAIYYDGMKVLLQRQDFYDLTYAYLKKAHENNVLYAEIFFDPQEHLGRGVSMQDIIEGMTEARLDAEKDMGIEAQLILCFVRDRSAASAMEALDAALPFKEHLVGIGLDSDEKDNPPVKFTAHFEKARAAGLKITGHCDLNQKNTLGHLRQALGEIKLDRIDHGGNILRSPELMALAKERDIYFTVCPKFSGKVRDEKGVTDVVRGMLDEGLNVTVNTDDPAYMDGEYMNEILRQTQIDSALTPAEMVQIQRNAFMAGWMPEARRADYLARLEAYAANWGIAA